MADHDEHDPLLVAALLDRDLSESERAAGELLVASCPECADAPRRTPDARDGGRDACRPRRDRATSASPKPMPRGSGNRLQRPPVWAVR